MNQECKMLVLNRSQQSDPVRVTLACSGGVVSGNGAPVTEEAIKIHRRRGKSPRNDPDRPKVCSEDSTSAPFAADGGFPHRKTYETTAHQAPNHIANKERRIRP